MRNLALLTCALLNAACAPTVDGTGSDPVDPDPGPGGPATGLFTAAQADAGQRVFGDICAACHGLNEFRGPLFEITWMASPIGDFFEFISMYMPQDAPGSLTPEQYAAVTAYLLRQNDRPAGSVELPTDIERLKSLEWGGGSR